MPLKLTVQVNQYIAELNLFAVVVQHDLGFLDHIPRPVLLYLADGTKNNGFLVSQHTRGPKGGDVPAWGLLLQSDEIQNPSTANITAIEILDS